MVFRDFPRISPWGYNNISQGFVAAKWECELSSLMKRKETDSLAPFAYKCSINLTKQNAGIDIVKRASLNSPPRSQQSKEL